MPLAEPKPLPDFDPGTYEAAVADVQPDTIVPRQGRNAGKDVPVLRWTWAVEAVDENVESITSRDPSSEKSNLFKYFVALLGSDRNAWLKAETSDLVGRKALITISFDENGYAKVDNVVAMPKARRAEAPAAVEADGPVFVQTPVESVSPLRSEPEDGDDLPF